MQRAGEFLVRHRLWMWGFVLLFSVPPMLGFMGFRWLEEEYDDWGEIEDRIELIEAQESFTFIGLPCVIVAECNNFFEPSRIDALRQAARRIEATDGVETVIWAGDIPHWTWRGLAPLLPPEAEVDDLDAVREEMLKHPLVANQLLSADGKVWLVPIVIGWGPDAMGQVRATLQESLAGTGITARLTGMLPLWSAHHEAQEAEHHRILLTAVALVVLLALVIFRRPSAIIIACSGPAVGVVWTMGWLLLLGLAGNDLAQIIVPVMVMMVGFTDGVHLVVDMRHRRHAGLNAEDAVAQTIAHVGMACLLTSFTTAIGFGSLLIGQSEMIRGFGLSAAIGVMVTFIATILVAPLLGCSWLGRRLHLGHERDLIGRNIESLAGLMNPVVRHPRWFAIGGTLLTAALIVPATSLKPDDRLAHRVPNESEAYQAMRVADRALGGLRVMQVVVHWTPEVDESVWPVLSDLRTALNDEQLWSRSLSICDALELVPGPESSAKLWLGSGVIPAEFRDQFWQPSLRRAQFIVRLRDLGMAAYEPALERLHQTIDRLEAAHAGTEITLTGEVLVDSRIVAINVRELMHSLLLAGVVILAVLAVAFRSLRLGLISIIPNALPIAAAAALRAMLDVSLDIASACSFAICLGIAVDDTIHFMTRFEHERASGYDAPTAVRRSFVTVGTAMVMTTVVMVAGFASVMTSQLPTHTLFAAMAITTLTIALPADLFVLPALLCLFPGKEPAGVEAGDGDGR